MAEAIFITRWKDKMYELMKAHYGKDTLDKDKCMKFLDEEIKKHINNRRITLVNNYTNLVAKSDILSLIDLIEKNHLIMGGGGVLYQQHAAKENPLIDFITHIMTERKRKKKERKNYDKGTDEWLMLDLGQLLLKIRINSLYGCMGYKGFPYYNRFIAESITNQGRQILSTAATGFENFLPDALTFSSEGELMEFLSNIHNEFKENLYENMDTDIFMDQLWGYPIENRVYDRLISKCKFDYDEFTFPDILKNIIKNKSTAELIVIYYKNNFSEFNKNEFIKNKYKYLMETIDELLLPELDAVKDDKCRQIMTDIWDFYKVFVQYNYPVYDRVRKNMYLDKKSIVGEDTDSNFICIQRFVDEYIKNDVLQHTYNKDVHKIEFIAVNIITTFLGFNVASTLGTLCKYMNVTKEYADRLGMKNEFYMERMIFVTTKKRYISNSIIQEGQLLNNGEGLPEIKGFDFKKSTVKLFVREYYENICQEDLLKPEAIDVENVFKKIMDLKVDIEESMRKGESKYFKQANVQLAEHYKKPYSSQGFTSILLWNALCPEYALELPTDVDIIPIKDLRNKKNMEWFKEKFSSAYSRLEKNILYNSNTELSKIGLKYIAKPKNSEIPLPEWFEELVDTEKVASDILSLFYPIMETLGLKILKTTSTTNYLSNMVDL